MKADITRTLNKALLFGKKNSDKIEFVVGNICVAAGTVFLIHDAEKISDVQVEVANRLDFIKDADNDPDGWENKEERKKYVSETIKIAVKGYTKGCWKGVSLVAFGEFLQYISHVTLTKKYNVVNTALAGTAAAFSNYRERVVKDQGKEKDYEYLTGGSMVSVEQKPDGTVTTTEVPLHTMGDTRTYIPHSFFLGDVKNFYLTSGNNGNVARGIDDLLRALNTENNVAKIQGYIFENKARYAMNIPETVAGQAAGMFYEEPDGSTNRLSLFARGVEIGDPSLLEGKPEDVLFEFKVVNTSKDGRITVKPLEDNILDRIADVDSASGIPKFGWFKC